MRDNPPDFEPGGVWTLPAWTTPEDVLIKQAQDTLWQINASIHGPLNNGDAIAGAVQGVGNENEELVDVEGPGALHRNADLRTGVEEWTGTIEEHMRRTNGLDTGGGKGTPAP